MALRWDDPKLAVKSDDRRTFKHRLLQSWYREEVLGAEPGVYTPSGKPRRVLGSLLHGDDLKFRPELNFLNVEAFNHAIKRIDAVHEAGGTLEPRRLKENMLSSMPACFNLFGALRSQPQLLDLVRETLDPLATAIVRVDCEWAPPPGDALSDKTAFDAVLVTAREDGSTHLIGIETKYTEPFSTTEYPADRYRKTHDECGWFHPDSAETLVGAATNQLWRNTLLAAACEMDGYASSASVAVVALADDSKAQSAVAGVRDALHEPEVRCAAVPFERFVDVARHLGGPVAAWANQFERRYLDLGPIRDVEADLYACLGRALIDDGP